MVREFEILFFIIGISFLLVQNPNRLFYFVIPKWWSYSYFLIFFFRQDTRHFVRAPPPGVDFPFDYEASYKVALATLAEDPNLQKMRFELVPKV